MLPFNHPNYCKLKTNLRLSIDRLKLKQKKKMELTSRQRNEIADYIAMGRTESARIKVEHIIQEDYLVEALEIVEDYCELLLARFNQIEKMKNMDDGISEAVSSIIWVTPLLQSEGCEELKNVSDQLTAKYGKLYATSCRENTFGHVSEKLVKKLKIKAPSQMTIESYLNEISKYYNAKINHESDLQDICDNEKLEKSHLNDLGILQSEKATLCNVASNEFTQPKISNGTHLFSANRLDNVDGSQHVQNNEYKDGLNSCKKYSISDTAKLSEETKFSENFEWPEIPIDPVLDEEKDISKDLKKDDASFVDVDDLIIRLNKLKRKN